MVEEDMNPQYYCPCCKQRHDGYEVGGRRQRVLRRFGVIGGGRRPNHSCPLCHCSDRERLVYVFLEMFNSFERDGKILHIAPERKIKERFQSGRHQAYIAADLMPASHDVVKLDVTTLPFDDCTFDLVICNHVFEHVIKDNLAMKELCRVLSPGGVATLQVPIASHLTTTYEEFQFQATPELRLAHFGQQDHVRIYARDDYLTRLTRAGFTVVPSKLAKAIGNTLAERYGLNMNEELFIGIKHSA